MYHSHSGTQQHLKASVIQGLPVKAVCMGRSTQKLYGKPPVQRVSVGHR